MKFDRVRVKELLVLLVALAASVSFAGSRSDAADPYDALHEAVMARRDSDGKTYGLDSATPLIWNTSDHLLAGENYRQLIQRLDAFDALSDAEIADYDDVRRALMQRSLWSIFDWSTVRRPPTFKPEDEELRRARYTIQGKVGRLMKRLALSEEEILALPNNLLETIRSKQFPSDYDPKDHLKPFLPADLLDDGGPWVCLDHADGSEVTEFHTIILGTASTFIVYIRLPGTRQDTLDYVKELSEFAEPLVFGESRIRLNPKTPQFPVGTQFALIERPFLISDQREIILSPLVYTVQLRAYLNLAAVLPASDVSQAVAKFVIQPRALMQGKPAMRPIERDETHFSKFFTKDPFLGGERLLRQFQNHLNTCMTCHGAAGVASFNSRGVIDINQKLQLPPKLREGTPQSAAVRTRVKKQREYAWGLLEATWRDN